MQLHRYFGLRFHLVLLFFALGLWGCDGLFQDLDRIAYSGEPSVGGPDSGEGGPGDSGGGEKNGAEENGGRTNMNAGSPTDLNAGDSRNEYEEPPDEGEVDAGEFDSDVSEEVDAGGDSCITNDDCGTDQECRDGECVLKSGDTPNPDGENGGNSEGSCFSSDDCLDSQICDDEGYCVDRP